MSRNPFFSDGLEDRLPMDVEVTHPGADDRFTYPPDRFNPHLLQPEEPEPDVHDHDEFVVMWEGDGFSPRDAYQRLFERLFWGEIPPEEMPARRCVAVGELPLVAAEMARGVNCCAVCVEDYTEGELVSRLPCGHCFHKDCISPWFQTRVTCPMCRFKLV